MKRIIFICLVLSLSWSVMAQNIEKEKEAIKKVIQTSYVEGLQNEGDLDKIDSGIHPDFHLIGIGKDNSMWDLPISKWKENIEKQKKEGHFPRSADKMVSVKFVNIDITGTAAVAKIRFYAGEKLKYIDYISLYHFSDGWKMVNKIFYKMPEKE